ncbi:MAG: hypothetical protein ACRDZR_17090 [Acidimicrobiales bacterium]
MDVLFGTGGLRRLAGVAAAAAVVAATGLGGLVATAGPAGASAVTDVQVCLNSGYVYTGGCTTGTTVGTAGQTGHFGIGFKATTALPPGDFIHFTAPTGTVFPRAETKYEISAGSEFCLLGRGTFPFSTYGYSSIWVHVPTGCTTGGNAAGTFFALYPLSVRYPTTAGTYTVAVQTQTDTTSVSSNTFKIVSPPSPPLTAQATPSNTKVHLTWKAPASDLHP